MIAGLSLLERKTRFELVTLSLARRCSTAEPLPLYYGAKAQNRTGDTRIFSPLLYRLSYLGTRNIVIAGSTAVKQAELLTEREGIVFLAG